MCQRYRLIPFLLTALVFVLALLGVVTSQAQLTYEPYVITVFAGTNGNTGTKDGVGTAASFNTPSGVALDSAGNIYVADTGNHTIRKISAGAVVSTLAGSALQSGSTDGTGSAARFNNPMAIAVDNGGNLYVADAGNSTIRKVTPAGVVTTLAGSAGSVGSVDGTGSAARFNHPDAVAVDSTGTIYVADTRNYTIRKLLPDGVVTTLAGTAGTNGGVDGAGSAARFGFIEGLVVDNTGNLYAGDTNAIRKITPAGVVTTFAGSLNSGGSKDGTGGAARFNDVFGVALDKAGNLYVAEYLGQTIRKVTPAAVVTTLAGAPGQFGRIDGTGSAARFANPGGMAVDETGNIYVADTRSYTIRTGTALGKGAHLRLSVTIQTSPFRNLDTEPIQIGDKITYHCVVTNLGGEAANNVFGFLGPDNNGTTDKYETFQSSAPPLDHADAQGFRYFQLIDNLTSAVTSQLAPGATGHFDVVFTATAGGSSHRVVGVSSPDDTKQDLNSTTTSLVIQDNSGIPSVAATNLFVNNSNSNPVVPVDSVIRFRATNLSTAGHLSLRVQASTSPGDESSWKDLPDGNSGHMVYDVKNRVWVLNTTAYPLSQNVHFRAIGKAPGLVDSISNVVGSFNLTSATPHLGPTHFLIQGSPAASKFSPGNEAHFSATLENNTSGVDLRVQTSTNPGDETSWTFLNDGGGGFLKAGATPGQYYLDTKKYPSGDGVYFRVIAIGSGFITSLSNVVGPFTLFLNAPPTVTLTPPASQGGDGTRSNPYLIEEGANGATYTYSATATDDGQVTSLTLASGPDGLEVVKHVDDASAASGPVTTRVQGDQILNATAIDDVGAQGYAAPIYIRILPAANSGAKTFTMLQSGDWESDASWRALDGSNGVPRVLDTAIIPAGLTASIASGRQITVASVTAGNISGPGALTATQSFNWNGGTVSNLTLTTPSSAFLTVRDGAPGILTNMTLNTAGSMTINLDNGATITADGGTTVNNSGAIKVTAHRDNQLKGYLELSAIGHLNTGGQIILNGVEVRLPSFNPQALRASLHAATTSAPTSQTGGSVDLGSADAPSKVTGDFVLAGGSLTGNGAIQGSLYNLGGFLSPGHSAGAFDVTGNYVQGSDASLLLQIGGTNANGSTPDYDQLQVGGAAQLDGKVIVRTINGFTPGASTTFVPLGYSSLTGSFARSSGNVQLTLAPTGLDLKVSGANPPSPKALNISTRMRVESGDNALIGGFIITGTAPKKVIIRAIGPSLPVPGALANPTLELHQPDGTTVSNDNWKDTQEQEITDSTIPPSNDLESAIVATIPPGAYTAIVRGKDNGTGVGLVEVYDLGTAAPETLANISTRGQVQGGDNVMIGGFIIGGTEPANILVRAIGPSLTARGVPGALQDPVLELHDKNGNVISNDNWRSTQESEINATGVPPVDDKESAILATLFPDPYTAIVRGKNDVTGVAVVEAYNLQ